MRLFVLAASLSIALSSPCLAFESVYTGVNLDKGCTSLEKSDDDGGSWKCKGYKDYSVWFSEGDLRQSIFYGDVGDWYKAGAWESFGPFNHFGGKVEWLIENGKPFAAITRFFVQNPQEETSKNEGQVLVVSKVGQKGVGEACVVGYVDARANKKPNVLARKVAMDLAKSFVCRKDEPVYHGIKGPTAGEPYRSFGQ